MDQRSPFKFLDAYDKSDRAIFFGRDREIEELYDMAFQSHLTLVYGRSGTGKTSLIQCGLANRFKTSDWLDVYIRRKENINDSLLEALTKLRDLRKRESGSSLKERLQRNRTDSSGPTAAKDQSSTDIHEVVSVLKDLDRQYFKPIYLIFDQFEELFILGDQEDEQPRFYDTIAEILEHCPFCKLVFILREEAIADLHDFEKVVPSLFDQRLRVEQLSRANVEQVITETTSKFDIQLENDGVADAIIEAISSGKGRAELTYLQVFLDALWHKADVGNDDQPVFKLGDVHALGGIDDVLADFLGVQSGLIQERMSEKYSGLNDNSVGYILDAFVSLEGTKQPRSKRELHHPKVTDEQIAYCLEQLEQARILRFDEERYELAHDALAAKIAEDRSSADIAFLEVVRLIKDRYRAYDRTQTYLNNAELALHDTYSARITEEAQLNAEQKAYVKASHVENGKRRRRRNVTIGSVGAVLTIALIFMAYLWFDLRESSYKNLLNVAQQQFDSGEYEAAILTYNAAADLGDRDYVQKMLEEAQVLQDDKPEFDSLLELAEERMRKEDTDTFIETTRDLIQARELLTSTLDLNRNENDSIEVALHLESIRVDLTNRHRELTRSANLMFIADSEEGYKQALKHYEVAQAVEENAYVEGRILECKQNLEADE